MTTLTGFSPTGFTPESLEDYRGFSHYGLYLLYLIYLRNWDWTLGLWTFGLSDFGPLDFGIWNTMDGLEKDTQSKHTLAHWVRTLTLVRHESHSLHIRGRMGEKANHEAGWDVYLSCFVAFLGAWTLSVPCGGFVQIVLGASDNKSISVCVSLNHLSLIYKYNQ